MRVLQLIDSLHAGGAERMAVTLANSWAAAGHESFLCATRQEGLLERAIDAKVTYLFLRRSATFDLRALWRLRTFVKQHEITLVHAHASSYFIGTLLRLLCPSIRLVWHDHYGQSEALDNRPYKVLKHCSRFFSAICCVNDKLRDWCQTHLYTKTIYYVPNFSVSVVEEEPLSNLKGTDGKRLLCVANLRPQKDHVSLIKAFRAVLRSHPEWTLHCVGHDFGDSYARAIKRLVKDLNLESKVFFYGSRTDVHAFMRTCDIGVLSSQSEGLPLVLLEYGQAAMPVVATAVGDCAKVIKDGVTGLMVPPEAAEALAKALQQLMTDPLLRHKLGKALKAHVEESFGVAQALKVLSLVYHQAMERN